MESSFKKFTKDVLVIGAANIVNSLSGIIFLPLITKNLGASEYGVWVQVQTAVSLVLGVTGLGLPYALSRFLAAKTKKADIREEFWSVFSLVSASTAIMSIIVIATADFIARAFFNGATDIVRIAGFIMLANSLNVVFLSLFRALRQMKVYAIFSIVSTYLQIGLVAYLVLNGHGLLSMVLVVLSINIFLCIILFFFVQRVIGIEKPRFSKIREYLNFGVPTIPSNIASWIVYSSDRFIIAYFLGAAHVGIYSSAYSLGSLPQMISLVTGFILPPTLSKLYDEGRIGEMKALVSYTFKYSIMIVIPFIFGAALLSNQVLRMFTTPEIASEGQVVLIFESINSALLISCGLFNFGLMLLKKTKIVGITWLCAAVVNLLVDLLLVPRIGILGAAIGTLAAYITAEGVQLYYSLREIRVKIEWLFVIKCFIASGVMSLVVFFIHPENTSTVILSILAGIVTYAIFLFILKGFKKEEYLFFSGFFRRQISNTKMSDGNTK